MQPLAEVATRLRTPRDLVRFGATAFNEAGLHFGHGTDNAVDDALALVLHALQLEPPLEHDFLDARLTDREISRIYALYRRRIEERMPVPYLTHRAWFAGLSFYVDERVVIPRSPIAELVSRRFEPWIDPSGLRNALDLCCGSGCIGIAIAHAFPGARVDLVDRDPEALEVARRNVTGHGLGERVQVIASDLYAGLTGRCYDLIVCNPPYVATAEWAELPPEYKREPRAGLESGARGLDQPLRVLSGAAAHLDPGGALVLEVGATQSALQSAVPQLAAVWVDLERGGEGIAFLSREELTAPGALDIAA